MRRRRRRHQFEEPELVDEALAKVRMQPVVVEADGERAVGVVREAEAAPEGDDELRDELSQQSSESTTEHDRPTSSTSQAG